jgi:hypothetical protein
MLVVVPHIRRSAHDDEEVVRAPVRDRLTLVEHYSVDSNPTGVQHIAVDTDRILAQAAAPRPRTADTLQWFSGD